MGAVTARGSVVAELASPQMPTARPDARALALIRAALWVMGPVLVVGALGTVSLLSWDRWELGALLLLVQCLPLAVRDRFPVPVLIVTAAGTVAQVLVGMPPSNGFMGQAVALAGVVRRTAWPLSLAPTVAVFLINLAAVSAAGVPDVGRLAVIYATTFGVAWALGDAAARRAIVDQSVEREIASQTRTAALRAELGGAAERLRIARELHALTGSSLHSILARAAAARRRPREDLTGEEAATIERIGREVLADLDRFLSLLRRRPAPVAATEPVAVPVVAEARFGPWQRHVPIVTLVAPAVVVGVLTVVDGLSLAGAWPGAGWVVLYAGAAALPLLMRRRRPCLALVVLTIASMVPLLLGLPVADGPLGIVVAAHAVASYRSRRTALVLAGCSVTTITVLAMVVSVAYAVQLGTLLLIFTAVGVYVGDTARLARAHDATLAQRLRNVHEQTRLAEQAAVADERARAARDLHDSIGHVMSLIVLQAGAVRLALARDGGTCPETEEALSAIETVAQRALAQLDGMLTGEDILDPDQRITPDGHAQLATALQHLANDVHEAGGPVELTIGELGEVPASLHAAVYRLVQEALTNVLKHAPGGRAVVSVARAQDKVIVTVANTPGDPTRATSLPSTSRGLAGMRERVALFSGHLTCGSTQDGGFTVSVQLPVPDPTPSPATSTGVPG